MADSAGATGDPGTTPDLYTPNMPVTLTLSVAGDPDTPEIRVQDADPPTTLLLVPVQAQVESGVLRLPGAGSSVDGVDIVAKSSIMGLGDKALLLTARFGTVTIGKKSYTYDPVTVLVPTVEPADYKAGLKQYVRFTGNVTGGQWALVWGRNPTQWLTKTTTVTALRDALRAVVGNNGVDVTGTLGDYVVTFDPLLNPRPPALGSIDNLTGTGLPGIEVVDDYTPPIIDLTTAERVLTAPSTPNTVVARLIPDEYDVSEDGELSFYSNHVKLPSTRRTLPSAAWATVAGKPAVIASGSTVSAARESIDTDTFGAYTAHRDGLADDWLALAGADADAAAAKKPLLLLAGTHRVSNDLTITSPVTFRPGAVIKPDNGVTVTLTSGVAAPPQQRLFDVSAGGGVTVYMPVVYAQWWGAKIDGTTDDTTAFQAAVTSCRLSPASFAQGLPWSGQQKGGGVIVLPPGTLLHSGITLHTGCYLRGAGMLVTTLKLKDGANTHAVRGFTSPGGATPNARAFGASDLTIECNGANQVGLWNGVHLQTVANTGEPNPDDMHSQWENVWIRNATDTGFFAYGAKGINRCYNVLASNCGYNGFQTGKDSQFVSCESDGTTNGPGFLIRAGSTELIGCKSWRSGWNYNGSNSATVLSNKTAQPGFSVAVNRGLVTLTGCNAQNNMGGGFYLTGDSLVLSGCTADSNNMLPGADPDANPGVKVNHVTNSMIDVACYAGAYQGGVLLGNQHHALLITDLTSTNNIIRITQSTAPDDAASQALKGSALDPASVVHGSNQLTLNDVPGKVAQTASASRVYGTDGSGNQTTISYGSGATASALVQRQSDGAVIVNATPTGGTHAASKGYVDSLATDAATYAAASKSTPVDADAIPIIDSAATNTLKKLTWANLKATLAAVTKTGSASRVYITDGSGNQSTASYSQLATPSAIMQRDTNGASRLPVFATGSRPTAAAAGAGNVIYDSTLSKPIYSDGTAWRDAAGTAV
ncbi:glycosyl hydrolase family 28-related protein [Mycolicibacterium psychrotolerans]|uniref:right-handed parallel beta-helix repeat-containing protein n=1 Tax=Mycolicibacterium psychrotolerans TaxID=216929 RepID=UPI003D66DE89